MISIKEAEAVAAKAARRDGGGEDSGSDDSESGGQPNAQALAMMNNPNMPAEAKAAMAQYMSPAGKKGIAAQYAGATKGMKNAMETSVDAAGGSVAGHLLHVCPHGTEKVTRGEYSYPEFFKVMDELEPDGWVSVRSRFGENRSQKGGYMEGVSMTSSQFLPVWVYEVSVHNMKGKRVWEPGGRENEILSDNVKLPKDEAGKKKAIRDSIPESVGQLVEKLTE